MPQNQNMYPFIFFDIENIISSFRVIYHSNLDTLEIIRNLKKTTLTTRSPTNVT